MTAPTLRWRHFVEIGRDHLWIAISASDSTVHVLVTGRVRYLPVDHADSRRIIPSDLADRRILLDELAHIIDEALPDATPPTVLRAAMRNVRGNLGTLTE
ncbi:hypothetical protein G3N30_03900 [Microbacterium lacticum]|uniref:hypothetical protein n=1 Tax=Microbacterium lacticum TaxID=33885 RepID=UPI0018B0A906|nr:hypothetical protein [Microbacterium lacticum]MBF9335408.1 hypothetical protein [Microbacterium lacticum]